jgi:hypothetical protein
MRSVTNKAGCESGYNASVVEAVVGRASKRSLGQRYLDARWKGAATVLRCCLHVHVCMHVWMCAARVSKVQGVPQAALQRLTSLLHNVYFCV